MHYLTRELYLGWEGLFVGRKRKDTWKVAPLHLFWTIWKERNKSAFYNCESLDQTFKNSFVYLFQNQVTLLDCKLRMVLFQYVDFVDWLGALHMVQLLVFVYSCYF